MNKQEEKKLLKQRSTNQEARNKLINHNLRLVANVLKKFKNEIYEYDDLFQIGVIGLIKAVGSYQGQSEFSIYAQKMIEEEIQLFLNQQRFLH